MTVKIQYTGRFWTMDSYEGRTADPATLHKYLYTHGDPVNGVDPSGMVTLTNAISAVSVAAIFSASLATIIESGVAIYDSLNGEYLEDDSARSARLTRYRLSHMVDPQDFEATVAEGLLVYRSDGMSALVRHFQQRPRYAFVRNLGWLDLQHVVAAAGVSERYGRITGQGLGWGMEVIQWLGGFLDLTRSPQGRAKWRESAFAYEDLNSNAVGDYFGSTGSHSLMITKNLVDLETAKILLRVK